MRTRSLLFLSFVALAAMVLAACGSVQATAATVNGTRISQSSIDDELRQIRDNKAYRDAVNVGDVEGTGKNGTFNAQFAARVLTLDIYYQLVDQELDKRRLKVTDADLAKAQTSLEQGLGQDQKTGTADPAKGKKVLAAFSKDYRDTLVHRQAALAKLEADLGKQSVSAADVKKYYDENKQQFTEVCAKHILVDTEQAANDIAAQLKGGADFATVAKEKSKDTGSAQNGGDLGCQPAGSYVTEFQKATLEQPLNQVGNPVKSQFGWHVIVVTKRTEKSLSDVQSQIRDQLQQQQSSPLDAWLVKVLKTAKVSVSARFGTFKSPGQGQPAQVVPPTKPTTTARGSSGK